MVLLAERLGPRLVFNFCRHPCDVAWENMFFVAQKHNLEV